MTAFTPAQATDWDRYMKVRALTNWTAAQNAYGRDVLAPKMRIERAELEIANPSFVALYRQLYGNINE